MTDDEGRWDNDDDDVDDPSPEIQREYVVPELTFKHSTSKPTDSERKAVKAWMKKLIRMIYLFEMSLHAKIKHQ